MRVATYLRVSTEGQTLDPQRLELSQVCAARGWTDVREYADVISGAKASREGLDALLRAVRTRKVDVILCAKLDRLGRSFVHLAQILCELESHKVALICPSQGIDTTQDNPGAVFQTRILMAVAELERGYIRERTKRGLDAARARGVVFGRPRIRLTPQKEAVLATYRERKETPRCTLAELAKTLGVSIGKAHALATTPNS